MTDQDRGPLALATKVPLRRFEIRIGKMSLPDSFDINSVGSDSHLQFTNWTIDNNGAWDYAADTRGYTVGGILEYDDKVWSARYAIAAMPTIANGIDLDWAFSRANGQNWEFELRKGLFARWLNPKRQGAVRVLSYVNHAHMGDYRQSVQQYLSGQIVDARHHADRALRRGEVWLWPEHRAGGYRQPAALCALRLERGSARVIRLHRSGADRPLWRRLQRPQLAALERQNGRRVCLQRHQARPPELSSLRRTGFPARRRQPELWARGHHGVVLQRAYLARSLWHDWRNADRASRLQHATAGRCM